MEKTIIAEGKTTNEAIENGLRELKVPKSRVEIKVLESEDKRSFFSILAPRIVKVEMTVKENKSEVANPATVVKKEIELKKDEQEKAEQNLEQFLKEFTKQLPEGTTYKIKPTNNYINVEINNKDLGYLIGYRGENLYAMQNVLTAIAGKGIENRVRVILDIEGYKAKREKTLEELAEKVAKTVMKTRKSVKIETISVGEEPHRRIIVSLKKK